MPALMLLEPMPIPHPRDPETLDKELQDFRADAQKIEYRCRVRTNQNLTRESWTDCAIDLEWQRNRKLACLRPTVTDIIEQSIFDG